MYIMSKISYLWWGGKIGWQVTSFHPKEDPAIGFPKNGDVRMYISEDAYRDLQEEFRYLIEESKKTEAYWHHSDGLPANKFTELIDFLQKEHERK